MMYTIMIRTIKGKSAAITVVEANKETGVSAVVQHAHVNDDYYQAWVVTDEGPKKIYTREQESDRGNERELIFGTLAVFLNKDAT